MHAPAHSLFSGVCYLNQRTDGVTTVRRQYCSTNSHVTRCVIANSGDLKIQKHKMTCGVELDSVVYLEQLSVLHWVNFENKIPFRDPNHTTIAQKYMVRQGGFLFYTLRHFALLGSYCWQNSRSFSGPAKQFFQDPELDHFTPNNVSGASAVTQE